MKARHSLFFNPAHCPLDVSDARERHLLELKDWPFSLACCAHSCSRALKWGMKDFVTSDTLIDDVHIVISSLLRGSAGLFSVVDQYLASLVVFDRPDPSNNLDLEAMWQFLDVDPKDIPPFC